MRILDFGVQGSTPFLVMSYASGGTLRTRHPKGSIIPLTTIISYIKQSALALQHAHEQKLIHRDIKPENMLLGKSNDLLLSDFGIAAVAHSTTSLKTGAYSGTVHYSAPEQISGKPRPASDQYALGIIVYEWLTGMRPFSGTSHIEIAMHHLSDPPPPLRSKVPSISPDVEQVVMTALAKDPEQRFASVQAFATALEQAGIQPTVHSSNQSSPPDSISMRTPSVPDVAPSPPVLSFASTRPASPDTEVEPPVVVPVVTPPSSIPMPAAIVPDAASAPLESEPRIPSMSASPPSPPDISNVPPPDKLLVPPTRRISRRTVLVGLAGLVVAGGGLAWILAPHPLYTYRGHSDGVDAVAWSPNGRRIASGSNDQTVQVWDAATGGNVYTYRGHSNAQYGVLAVAWSPDGRRIASGSDDHTVQVWVPG